MPNGTGRFSPNVARTAASWHDNRVMVDTPIGTNYNGNGVGMLSLSGRYRCPERDLSMLSARICL